MLKISHTYSVFLSYARGDDQEFVARVYEFLQAHGFTVWWDRKCMPARALAFNEEIRDAIHRSERLVVVIGPRALRSDYVRAEWQCALSERKPVVTAIRLVPEGAPSPRGCLPPELKIFHAETFLATDGTEPPLDPLVRLLNDPIPLSTPIFGRPPERPPHFLPRPDVFSKLFAAVLGETVGPVVRTHEKRVTVLTGMGGIGKSVLAVSLVEAMRSRPTTFLADGIYWLGEDPLHRLAALQHVRTSGRDDRDLSDALAKQLEGKRFLLVVDNATSVKQTALLVRVLGPGGRMLVTTRHGELAVGHQHVPVDQLGEEESLRLVADWVGTQPDSLPPEAQHVVKRCGFHPFAIALNAAAASQGLPWSAILTALKQRELDYVEHQFEEYVYATVEKSLQISLDALPQADRARYLDLAAFFWESGVPAPAILRLWEQRAQLPEHRGSRLLVFLQQRSLLQLHGAPERYDVRLHDLHLMHIGRDEKKATALGRVLLKAYRPDEGSAWWNVVDDGYLRRCLVRHLLRSRPNRDALALLSAEDDAGRNAWYSARVHASATPGGEDGFQGYLADLALVFAKVPDCLFVLVAASLRSLARAVPAALLELAVADGRWSVQRASARARLIVEPEKRARAMIALLGRMHEREQWLNEILEAIVNSHAGDRKDLMRALAPALDEWELLPVLQRIVEWVRTASSPYEKTHTRPLVWSVLDRLPTALVAKAIAITEEIGLRPLRLYGLLAEPERSTRIKRALTERWDKADAVSVAVHAETVVALAEYLDPATAVRAIADAYERVRQLAPEPVRTRALAALLRYLPSHEQARTLEELITGARKDPQQFVHLTRQAPVSLHTQIRAAVEDLPLTWMAAVAPALVAEERRALMARVLAGIEANERSTSLLCMDGEQLLRAMDNLELDRARKIIDARLSGNKRVDALIALAGAIASEHRAGVLENVLGAIDTLEEADKREQAYQRVAPLLSTKQIAAVLASAERIGEPSGIAQLVKLLPHMSAPERGRATALVANHVQRNGIVQCHRALLAIPKGYVIGDADALFELATGLDNWHGRAHLLTAMAPRVGMRRRKRVATEARAAIAEHGEARVRIELLLELEAFDDVEVELEVAAAGMDADAFARNVAALAPHLDQKRADDWVGAALSQGGNGKHVLETLAPHLSANSALSYLALGIVPMRDADVEPLYRAINRRVPFVSVDEPAATAGALARRLGVLGKADTAFDLVRLGRNDEVTALALVELSRWLAPHHVVEIERRVASAELGRMSIALRVGRQTAGREYLYARLAPALARVGQLERALRYAAGAPEAWCIDSYLGIAAAVSPSACSAALLQTLDAVLAQPDVYRNEQIDEVAGAISRAETNCARAAWSKASDWAHGQSRPDAIGVLASMAPVAYVAGGRKLADELFQAIERVVRWWP